MRRIVVLGLVSLCAVLAVAGVGAGSALAAAELPVLLSFGGPGSAGGEFLFPRGVAVDNSTGASKGDVYVVDQNNYRLEKFGPTGVFVWAAGLEVNETKVDELNEPGNPHHVTSAEEDLCTAASGDVCKSGVPPASAPYGVGSLSGAEGVAVDPSSGDVYVQNWKLKRVEKFGPNGEPLLTFGGDVNETKLEEKEAGDSAITAAEEDVCTVASGDTCTTGVTGTEPGELESWSLGSEIAVGATGTVFVARKDSVQEFESDGVWKGEVSLEALSESGKVKALAVDATDESLYVYDSGAEGVHELELDGGVYKEAATVFDDGSSAIKAIAVDPANGEVFVNDKSTGELLVQAYSSAGVLLSESPAGALVESTGLGVARSGTVYAADSANESGANKVLVLGEPPATPPVLGAQSLVDAANTATVSAQINPLGRTAEWWVEYGPTASYGSKTAVSTIGPVLGEEGVSAILTGLLPETEYHYRFVANSTVGVAYGQDGAFETYGPAQSSLPDGRVYELVTPAYKNGNTLTPFSSFQFGIGEANGEAVAYTASGAMGASTFSTTSEFVSRHTPGVGWSTSQVEPRPTTPVELYSAPTSFIPSADFERFVFAGGQSAYTKEQSTYAKAGLSGTVNVLLTENPLAEPLWLGKPQLESPVPALGAVSEKNYLVAGASPELGEVYFAYSGTLLPQDEARRAHIGSGESTGAGGGDEIEPWGFYEWNHGTLEEAGELPDKSVSPFGAIPADLAGVNDSGSGDRQSENQADVQNNWLSDSGRRALFVSPDPLSSAVSNPVGCALNPGCTSEPPELYLREALPGGGHRVSLVSGSTLAGHEGEPATTGVAESPNALGTQAGTFAFASADGSQVFFASDDFLTKAAEEAGEAGPKEYDYTVETGAISYLPEVRGGIAAVAPDGSDLMFVNTTTSPRRLEMWTRSSAKATTVAELPNQIEVYKGITKEGGEAPGLRRAFVSGDGNVFVFLTKARIPGFNDGGFSCMKKEDNCHQPTEVFRYDISEGGLSCLSCGPAGVTPDGDASMGATSFLRESNSEEWGHENGNFVTPSTTIEARGISANGERVFFDTPNQLVPQATNGKRDVYEWESDGEGSCRLMGGCVYLISSGTSSEESYYVDNSESGDDVFFVTSAGLVAQDTDGSADMYDARVPRPGDTAPPSETPCKGAVCQGPPSTPSLLGAPPSETFSGPGDPAPALEVKPAVTSKPKAKAKVKKKRKKAKKSGKNKHRAHRSSRLGGKGKAASGRGK